MTAATGTVTAIVRADNGSFRYYGKIRLQAPHRYTGREVGLFVISHERDVREYLGKTIALNLANDILTASIEAKPRPVLFLAAGAVSFDGVRPRIFCCA